MRSQKVPRGPRGTFTFVEWLLISGCLIWAAAIVILIYLTRY